MTDEEATQVARNASICHWTSRRQALIEARTIISRFGWGDPGGRDKAYDALTKKINNCKREIDRLSKPA